MVRRLSPNNRKLEIADEIDASDLLQPDMLWAMGRELAAVHLGDGDRRDAVRVDFEGRKRRRFRAHVQSAVEFVGNEQQEWKRAAG